MSMLKLQHTLEDLDQAISQNKIMDEKQKEIEQLKSKPIKIGSSLKKNNLLWISKHVCLWSRTRKT